MNLILELKNKFGKIFGIGEDSPRVFFAPGRVNLIGEHIDYNGGYVFPCALSFGTYGLSRPRKDRKIRLYSKNFPEKGVVEFSLDNLNIRDKDCWTNYPKGIFKEFISMGHDIPSGMDILIYGNIPNGAGLSSSASLELVTSIMIKNSFSIDISTLDMVKLSQRTENSFIGVNCGIMDQFAVGMGKEGNAILLHCDTLNYRYIPLDLKDSVIIISNSNKKRGLADSKYNERRMECEEALRDLKNELSIDSLGEVTPEVFEKTKHLIKNNLHRKRAKHAVYENSRTMQAVISLERGNLDEFGKLMNESHDSLKDDYEVTGIELDTLVHLAREQRGVIGSRMTGAGFGGCTVSIVKKDMVDAFIENVGREYEKTCGLKASFYTAHIGDGTREILCDGTREILCDGVLL